MKVCRSSTCYRCNGLAQAPSLTTGTPSSECKRTKKSHFMPHDVFMSCSSYDRALADATCAALEAQGIRCWVAPRDVLAGTEYADGILGAITDCRAMVLIFSSHANDSPHVRREVERAVSKGKILLPFRIENVVPSRALEFCLGNTHWLDASTPPL